MNRIKGTLPFVLILVLTLWAMSDVGLLDQTRVGKGLGNLGIFLSGLFPPGLETLPVLWGAMKETLKIAFVGTILGFIFALPLALIAARTMFGHAVTAPVRFLLSAIRTVPSLLWAIMFVVAFGLGPAAGALGIAFYTVGYLGKLFSESFEGVDGEVIEAVRGVGCNRLQLMRFALLPEAANSILSQLLFIFEYNVRASTILGFVGAGGIGFYMYGYVERLEYQNLMTALLLTLAVVLAIDLASARIRKLVLPPVARPVTRG